MDISITRKDVVWKYIAQIFNFCSGLFILPFILNLLSVEEVGLHYIMLSISTLVALVDFGFSDQFGRNLTYVFSGAQKLNKSGLNEEVSDNINYRLLSSVIFTAKYIYRRLSIIALFLMFSLGSLYMYSISDKLKNVDNLSLIWLLFCISTYFNIYFKYYNSFLMGRALVMEYNISIILNKGAYIIVCVTCLCCGLGLFGVVLANLLSPFVGRFYAYHKFYTKELRSRLLSPTREEIKDTFAVLWYNAKRLGMNFIGAYGIQYSGTFVVGLFLSISDVASYGLMAQLTSVLLGFSNGLFSAYLPSFNSYRVLGDRERLIKYFAFSMAFYSFVYIMGSMILLVFGDNILMVIDSKTILPHVFVLLIYLLNHFLEGYHSLCSTVIVTGNKVPFVTAGLVTGFLITFSYFLLFRFTNLGLLGVVLGQFFISSAYNHWKWPKYIFDELNISLWQFFKIGNKEFVERFCIRTK